MPERGFEKNPQYYNAYINSVKQHFFKKAKNLKMPEDTHLR